MSEALKVEKRKVAGKHEARRLRLAGHVPANLYGHGQDNLALSAPADQLRAALRHGARVVDLTGAVEEKAFIRELQWDTFGIDVLHIDLTRVSADERLEVEVTVELRGQAPGSKEGGVVEQVVHEVEIECLAIAIPEKLTLRVGSLQMNGALMASDIELPEGVKLITDAETLIVHCVPPVSEDEGAEAAGSAEPEIIGRKEEEETEEE